MECKISIFSQYIKYLVFLFLLFDEKEMKILTKICLVAATMAVSATLCAQNVKSLTTSGDKARMNYDFESAASDYRRALDRTQDSTERIVLMEKITYCENGQSMLQYASRPEVVSSITVPRSKFFLFYGHFGDKAWRKQSGSEAFLYRENAEKVFIPMREKYGTYDIYTSERLSDTLWSPLQNMGSSINSTEDELYPVLSDDGRKLYFSSKGLFGMGGFDIFVSEWDESSNTWGEPENLGFPYSSPYDDMLFCSTPDGNFSLFASNRSCAQDSMTIYLLKFDNTPVKSPVASIEEARRIAALKPAGSGKVLDETDVQDASVFDESFRQYYTLVTRYGAVKDSIRMVQQELSRLRGLYAKGDESDRSSLKGEISSIEDIVLALQTRLGDVSSDLQVVEMDFLVRGTTINPEEFEIASQEAELEQTFSSENGPQYRFTQRTMGPAPHFNFAKPEVEADYTFRIQEESVVVEDFEMPEGLYYQIQMVSTSSKMPASRLKGICPVFEIRKGSKYVYRAGLFDTYAEANKRLSTVKGKGFSSAIIVAFNNGSEMNLKNARTLEAKNKENRKYRVVFREYPNGIPSEIMSIIRDKSSKDIARGAEDGAVIYFIAPLDRNSADSLAKAVEAAGAKGVSIEPIN